MQQYAYYIQDSQSWEKPGIATLGAYPNSPLLGVTINRMKDTPTTTVDLLYQGEPTNEDMTELEITKTLMHGYIRSMTQRLRDGIFAEPSSPPEHARAVYIYFNSMSGPVICLCPVDFYQAARDVMKESYNFSPQQFADYLGSTNGRFYIRLATDAEMETMPTLEFEKLVTNLKVPPEDGDLVKRFLELIPKYSRRKFFLGSVKTIN